MTAECLDGAAFAGSLLVVLILLVIVDLDRPRRRFVIVPRAHSLRCERA